ncbi:hypothetical protein DYB32_000002 [Aphanomyces invadans]|uniref:Plus3 domain-containing protein n=1 Tax=Aphanomyces invadans TaxID=157072 RepID=A0A3R6WUN8_9STRA|nr:hypothetical protein DYB32_000002 [Aphanomyces invadans]
MGLIRCGTRTKIDNDKHLISLYIDDKKVLTQLGPSFKTITTRLAERLIKSWKTLIEEIDPERLKGLNEVEKEALMLYVSYIFAKKSKDIALKKKLESEREALDEDNEVAGRRLRNRDSDSRKSALSNLKSIKQGDKSSKSILSKRFGGTNGNDDGSDFDEGDANRDELAEKRRRRKELQRASATEASSSHTSASASSSARTASKQEDPNHVELQEPDLSGPLEHRHALAVRVLITSPVISRAYVKVIIDDGADEGDRVYRFCQIVHMCYVEKEYVFAGEKTKKALMLAYGKDKRAFPLSGVSNHSLIEREFELWRIHLQTQGLSVPTKDQAKKHYAAVKALPLKHKYTDEEVTTMVNRKKASGLTQVSLGVEIVRLERDVAAAKTVNNFDKSMELEARLAQARQANEQRLAVKTEDVERINQINKRNREINMKRDMDASASNRAQMENMSAAQKLQYVRASASRRMYLSRDKIEANLAEGKLVQLPDGRIMTVNKLVEVEALPDDIIPDKAKKSKEEDVLVKMERKRKAQEAAVVEARVNAVEVQGDGNDIAHKTIRYMEDDGSWTTIRSAAEILEEQERKKRPVVSDEVKKNRRGISMKDYFNRVKERQANGDNAS